MANNDGRPYLTLTTPPSNEPPCECMMCNISKDLTKEDQASLPCLKRIPTRHLVEKGILSRNDRLPMSRSQKRRQSPAELPAVVPVELPVELPADSPVSKPEEELINGIPVSAVLFLRQIYRESEGIAYPDTSPNPDTEQPSSNADTSSVSSEELPEPSIRFSIDNLINEGKPQVWPHPESVLMVSDVGNVEHKPTLMPPSTLQRAVSHTASVGFSGYVAWSPRFETLETVSPSPKPKYVAYRPGLY
ncbi:hypothetical protein IWX90DRAFT_512611 [Phyllosticta citrichinensis]|uniref:Uncharacterized protein n=1 Tax=Phyllosticta citrichinensis TaxID=1130410 RepID=A0ABR1Y136_9PEZI